MRDNHPVIQELQNRLATLEAKVKTLEDAPDEDYVPAEYTCDWCGQTKKDDGYLLMGVPLCPKCAGRKPTADKPALKPQPGEVWMYKYPADGIVCAAQVVRLEEGNEFIAIQEWRLRGCWGGGLATSPIKREHLLRPATEEERHEFWRP